MSLPYLQHLANFFAELVVKYVGVAVVEFDGNPNTVLLNLVDLHVVRKMTDGVEYTMLIAGLVIYNVILHDFFWFDPDSPEKTLPITIPSRPT
jgi:hypothetical protein